MHPGLQRAWLQTGGMPVQPIHAIFRAAFDQVDRLEYLGAGCAKLYDRAGAQVGILQFQERPQSDVDAAVAEALAAVAAGLDPEHQPDPAAGDTVIRKLDMSDPVDRETARLATLNNGALVGSDRPDVPPLDLATYEPLLSGAGQVDLASYVRPAEPHSDPLRSLALYLAVTFAVLLAVSAAVAFMKGF